MYAWGDNDLGNSAVGDYSDKNIPATCKGSNKLEIKPWWI